MKSFQLHQADKAFLARHILPDLPDRIFDAHAHLFRADHMPDGKMPQGIPSSIQQLGLSEYRHYSEWLHPQDRVVGGLFFGIAFRGDRRGNNEFVAAELGGDSAFAAHSRGQMLVSPDMDGETVAKEVSRLGMVGLKPYHTMARPEGPTWNAPIEDYLHESHMEVAHEAKLTITLHMVRARALADPVNQKTIRRYCEHYPDSKLILAHAARGFNPWHTIEGIESLRGLNNVWFDTSAVTEAGAFEAIIETMGHEKLLYGTDFHVSHMRGRCVAIGDSFHWIYAEEMAIDEKHTLLEPVLIGLESLRSLLLAFRRMRLSERQIEDIFYTNGANLFGIG